MATIVTVTPYDKENEEAKHIRTNKRIAIETASGRVYISHDSVQGLFVTVHGDKSSTTVKFNDKAVV